MKWQHAVILISQIFIIGIGVVVGTNCYGAQFSEDVWQCKGFENKMVQCDSLKLRAVEEKQDELGLSGFIVISKTLEEDMKMNVEIYKILDIGPEFMYHLSGDICNTLQDETTAWYPLVQSMKINKCPIAADEYLIKDMTINLNHSRGMITHEFCGDYMIELSISKEGSTEKISCHEMGVSISEYEC